MTKVLSFAKKNAVVLIAALAAIITSVIVPPDEKYIGYFDFKTLTCLFCVLAVVCALRNIRFFYTMAKAIVRRFKNTRLCILALVYVTFIGSMLIANDMALLTFLPLGYFVLHTTGKEKYMAFTFIMQNIAANLGGMVTPFGNPQNLFLYSYFNIPDLEFMSIMFPPFILAIALITVCCLIFVRNEPLVIEEKAASLPKARTAIYLLLFALSIIIVFRVIDYRIGLIIIPLALIFLDWRALLQVDYGLLLTFVFFFIFSGNMARIDE
ncbi:MAG: citrate transporter, partial [Clostridia bacterium]|nr:citrate transporter [Clostridia bacterium]